jgi:hypothetical protein
MICFNSTAALFFSSPVRSRCFHRPSFSLSHSLENITVPLTLRPNNQPFGYSLSPSLALAARTREILLHSIASPRQDTKAGVTLQLDLARLASLCLLQFERLVLGFNLLFAFVCLCVQMNERGEGLQTR